MATRHSRRFAWLTVAVLLLLGGRARATWSIVLVDTATGEVAIGCATCLTGFDLEKYVPVMLVGVGGACAQANVDSSGANRLIIWDELQKGTHPKDILDILKANDPSHQSRQYGIVDLLGRRATFTGSNTSGWAGGVAGKTGSIVYAIQGNILTNANVVLDAEQAVINTAGDLAEKLMVAMEAAAAQGGDSRCTRFGKSAHCGFMMISRLGDIDGTTCERTQGCATGTYYMDLNVPNQVSSDPDPVIQLRTLYDSWRLALMGRPDHVLSTRTLADPAIPGNGTAQTTLTIGLVDLEGFPLTAGGATLSVTHAPSSSGLASIGAVTDHGNGTYSLPLTAGVGQGTDLLRVVVDDGLGRPVQLYPDTPLIIGNTLDVSTTTLSASTGGSADLLMNGPADPLGRPYLLLATASGTSPGMDLGGIVVPLNFDALLVYSLVHRNGANFVNTLGTLGADGTGAAQFVAGPGALLPLVGGTLSFAYFTLDPIDFPSNAVSVLIDP